MRHTILISLLFIIVTGCATTNLPPVTDQSFLFEEDEKRLWNRSEEEQKILNKSNLIYKDEELEAYLNDIARRLLPPEVFQHIPFRIMVIKNHLLNAFAYPNGYIYVHTGILSRMENEAQLATLLAHEVTHCTHRHLVKNFRSIKNKTAFFATVQVTLGGIGGGIGDLATLLGALGTIAAVSGYSKELETEADMNGLELMMKAGYDPNEAPKLFVHLKKEIEEEKIKEPFFFGTHPRLKERIENYEDLLKSQYKEREGGIKNTEMFLEKISKVIFDNALLDLKAGRFKIAKNGVEKYLTLKSDDVQGYFLIGEIYRQKGEKGDSEIAKEYYEKAISLDPSFPYSYKGIGLIYYKNGQKSLAKKYLETYLTLSSQASDKGYIEEYIKQCNEGGGQ